MSHLLIIHRTRRFALGLDACGQPLVVPIAPPAVSSRPPARVAPPAAARPGEGLRIGAAIALRVLLLVAAALLAAALVGAALAVGCVRIGVARALRSPPLRRLASAGRRNVQS